MTDPSPATHPILTGYRLPDEALDRFLAEDCPCGDLTTILLGIGERTGRLTFGTRHDTTLCCTEEAARLLGRAGCSVTLAEPSGTRLEGGRTFLEARGSAGSLHTGWKVCVNLLEYASGIATRTWELVTEARAGNPEVEVVATRKIFPGTKAVATKAVYAGGALPHRLGLSESVLVFAQHAAFLGSKEELWARVRDMKTRAKEKKIGVEADDPAGALAAARAGADLIQVDKMDPAELKSLVEELRRGAPGAIIAAAGGINEKNARAYAATGVDLLVTSAVYWGKPADIGAKITTTD